MRSTTELSNMRDAVMAAILDLGEEHKEVMMLDADLASCLGSNKFADVCPGRFFDCGIAEANMIGVAAGLSSMGMRPFVHTFGCFASRRDFDQFFLSVGYAHQVIHLIGSDPGVTAQLNGGTHMPFEDIALMRQVPGVTIIDPSDAYSCYELIKQAYALDKPSYTRAARKGITHRYDASTPIVLGKGIELADGKDVAIIATGEVMVTESMKALDLLKEQGINATVVDMHTIRPLDTEIIDKVSARCGKILVCENGRYPGGVGEAIAAHIVKTSPVKMDFVNVGERFGEVGKLPYLKSAFGFTAENIAKKAAGLVK